MPTYNRAKLLKRAIDSALNQTFADFELIVVDDGSTDNTGEVLARIADQRLQIIKQPNAGPAAARNTALESAKGTFIAYLDSDNTFHPDFLKVLADELTEPFVAAYTGQNLFLVDGNLDEPHVIGRKTRSLPFNPAAFQNGNYIDIGCFVHRADIIKIVGTFDPSQPWAEDWDLIARIAIQYPFYIKHIDQVLCDYYAYLPEALPTMTNQSKAWAVNIKRAFGVGPTEARDKKLAEHITTLVRKRYPR